MCSAMCHFADRVIPSVDIGADDLLVNSSFISISDDVRASRYLNQLISFGEARLSELATFQGLGCFLPLFFPQAESSVDL